MDCARAVAGFILIGMWSPATPDSPSIKVLVLDALNGRPQANVKVEYLCEEIPHSLHTYAVTDVTGIAHVPYTCHSGAKIVISAIPLLPKEGCGSGVLAAITDIVSTGLISSPNSDGGICPTKISHNLKPTPGQVTLFVKKPTWWQSHVAG